MHSQRCSTCSSCMHPAWKKACLGKKQHRRSLIDQLPGPVLGIVAAYAPKLLLTTKVLHGNLNVFSEVVKASGLALRMATPALRETRSLALQATRASPAALECTPFANNKNFMLEAVQGNPLVLEHAHADLRADREVVRIAVRTDGRALEFASRDLQEDFEIALLATVNYGMALQFVKGSLRDRREIVIEALRENGLAIMFVSEALRAERDIVEEAVASHGNALAWASASLRCDKRVVMLAVKNNAWSLQHAAVRFRYDRDVALLAVEQKGCILQLFQDLCADEEVVLGAVRQDGYGLKYASRGLRGTKGIVMAAVSQAGNSLQFAHKTIRRDREVVLCAVGNNGLALQWADVSLQEDLEVVRVALRQNRKAVRYVSRELVLDRILCAPPTESTKKKSIFKKVKLKLKLFPKDTLYIHLVIHILYLI